MLTAIHTYPADTLPDAGNLVNFGSYFWDFCIITYICYLVKVYKQTSYVILVIVAKQCVSLFCLLSK
jgi:hypothetical protein